MEYCLPCSFFESASFSELPEPILMILGAKWPHSGVLLEKLKNILIFENLGPLFCENDEKWTKLLTKTMRGSDFHWKIYPSNGKISDIIFGKSFIFYWSRFPQNLNAIGTILAWIAPNHYSALKTRCWTHLPSTSSQPVGRMPAPIQVLFFLNSDLLKCQTRW